MLFAFGMKLLLLIAGMVFMQGMLLQGSWAELFMRNDSYWYEMIASQGYPHQAPLPHQQSSFPFFPLYPALVSLIQLLKIPFPLAAFLLGCVLTWLWVHVVFRYFRACGKDDSFSFRIVVLMQVFPWHYFFHVYYTELLFSLLLILVLLYIQIKKPLPLFLASFFLVLCRPTGIVFAASAIPLFFVANGLQGAVFRIRSWLKLWPLLGAPAGLLAFMAYLKMHCGDALAFSHAQSGWDRSWDWPWNLFFSKGGIDNMILSVWTLILLVLVVVSMRKSKTEERIFVYTNALFPLLTGQLLSYYRLLAVNVPVFSNLLHLIGKKGFVAVCAMLLIANLFTWWYWVRGMGILAY